MTKKLFVVLVVITTMLISFSLVIAAKKAPRGIPEPYVKQTIAHQQSPTPMPRGSITATLEATNLYPDRGAKAAAASASTSGSSGRIEAGSLVYTKDYCDLYGVPAYYITNWFYGLEWYANYQDPEEHGCVDVWPFEVLDVGFDLNIDFAYDIDVQGFVYSNVGGAGCPFPGVELCATPIYTVSIPSDGWWTISLPMTEQCCVDEPYFAVIYIYTDLYGLGVDPVAEDDPTDVCRSYNDYGGGWEDLVVDYGWPGEMILWSTGYTNPQNDCDGGPTDECRLQHDNGGAQSYFSGWNVGDQNATYFDPAVDCECDPVYPMHITELEGAFYDFAGVGVVDVIFHFYHAGEICDGPGADFFSFPATITTFYPDVAVVPVPDLLCLNDDFFLAVEYMSGITGEIPCILFDNQQEMVDTCFQWNDYLDYGWIEWWDFWAPPIAGWLMLRAVGVCAAAECYPGEECDLFQGTGAASSYFSGWNVDDKIAKYYDPEEYCMPPVYPYRIADVEFGFYDFAGVGATDVQIAIYLECSDPCDGPGTQIYLSDPINVTTFYPNLTHIDLADVVCVFEPFFVAIISASGTPGEIPSVLFDNGVCDTCHAWVWYGGYSPPWWEWSDFWSPPPPGCPMIYVSGYTESPLCDIPPCDTVLETLYGGLSPAYYWKQPPNDQFINMRYEMPSDHKGRLEYFEVGFYEAGSFGTPEPDMYVWFSDGTYPLDNNPPYQAIAAFHTDVIVWYPGYTTFDAYPFNIIFDEGELFHIGGTHAHEVDDTLAWLSDDGSIPNDRASAWDGAAWGGYDPYQFIINAIICPFAPDQPTFSMKCRPTTGFATPGDPPVDVYTIEIGQVIGYTEIVTLSLLPPGYDITATFNPNMVACPFTSDVAIQVGAAVAYGDYTLTFQAEGADGQIKTCNVTLRVQPPYDEDIVHFYHGTQGVSNFGALGNDASSDNFNWYGTNALYDGSIISLNPGYPWEEWEDHMALDMYDCQYIGFIPNQHLTLVNEPWCPGSADEEYYGEIAYGEFYTEEDVISCEWDSLFIIGLSDVECTDFSIKIKIYYNPYGPDIDSMYAGVFEDWDVGDAYSNWGDMDPDHNMIYQWDVADPSIVFGIMKAPFYDEPMHGLIFVHNATEVYPTGDSSLNCGNDPGLGYLGRLMTRGGYRMPDYWYPDPDDYSTLIVGQPFALPQYGKHIEIWIDFGRNLNDGMTWEQWYKKILRYVGFYRGDVNASDTLDLPTLDVSDLVYLINYLYRGGPAPLPFADQGDVDAKGPYGAYPCDKLDVICPKNNVDLQDLVYLLNYIYRGGPPPLDRVRFIEQCWTRPSLFENPLWH